MRSSVSIWHRQWDITGIHSEEFSPMRILSPKDASGAFHFKICTVQVMLLKSSNRSCLHMELLLQNYVWILPIPEKKKKKVCLMLCLSHFHHKLKYLKGRNFILEWVHTQSSLNTFCIIKSHPTIVLLWAADNIVFIKNMFSGDEKCCSKHHPNVENVVFTLDRCHPCLAG